ncbi:hypothetical protein [Verrucomicrobium spinosum]|uniref:hypothetical protein n=1 Tax=Verrucomicrobium spinosum TaxID=2736 RepID=UPI0009E99B9C|nr:hypothetical protein [Verrucomicrobium spinosum]
MLASGPSLAAADPTSAEPWKNSSDPVARLWQRVQSGQVKLPVEGDEKTFLQAVLKELDVPMASQVLVFSKTSLQNALIGPCGRGRFISLRRCMWLGAGRAD